MNDPTIIGLLVPAFSAQAVVNEREALIRLYAHGTLRGSEYEGLVNEANKVFQYPEDYDIVAIVAVKYGIKYVLLTNVTPEVRRVGLWARGVRITPPMPALTFEEYQILFNANPYLIQVYKNDACVIYKVNL
mgnify:CR=1 FL=1